MYRRPLERTGGDQDSPAANSHILETILQPCGVRSSHARWPHSLKHRVLLSTRRRWQRSELSLAMAASPLRVMDSEKLGSVRHFSSPVAWSMQTSGQLSGPWPSAP